MTGRALFASFVALAAAACEQEVIRVDPMPAGDDRYAKMIAAVDTFIAAKRSPAAYADLASTIATLRPGMDAALAREAERRMLVLALGPVKAVIDKPMSEQVDALAVTVWPTLLAPRIAADALLSVADPKAQEIPPKPNENPHQYLLRLCFGPLASECKRAVPEFHGNIVAALAARRATERVRIAVSDCLECSSDSSDPGWRAAVSGWEQIDRLLAAEVPAVESRSHPDNWPRAGAAAEDDPGLPEAEVRPRGELVVAGHAYGPNRQRIAVLRELRGKSDVIALHFRPDTSLERVRAVLIDARKAGCARVAVIAREPVYPYRRRVYYVADGYGLRANLRPTDSLQLLLHAVDEVAGPGTVARVD